MDDWDQTMNINARDAALCTKAAGEPSQQRGSGEAESWGARP